MNATTSLGLCLIGGVVLIVFVFLANAIRIVPEYQRLVVFRLGRCIGQKGPGLVILIPIVDRAVKVDLREQVREIPHQTSITKDNAPISIDFLWYYKVLDPAESVLQVGNFEVAAQGMATTTLRAVIGGIPLDDVLSEREHINTMLRTRLDEVTERWGVKVTNVEIREIIPPREVQEAMNRQMSAERIRRAVVTESTGTREAAINVAEGEKQAAILRAEGSKQSAILEAEGQQQAQQLKAQGFARALEEIFAAAKTIDQKTMTLQYFDTLKSLGQGASTKYIFPMEFTSLIENFVKGENS
jgi:regulator of protease activity HflC (stomatin/prohibitin superfamily)